MKKNKANKSKTFNKDFWLRFSPFLFAFLIILFFPILFTQLYWFKLDFTDTGEIGDTIGGIMGPFIAIVASILTFMAFWVQYEANMNQKKDIKIERFENKFYEMLRIQRENLNEIEIGDTLKSRKAFISLFLELRFCYACIKKFIEDYNHNELGFKESDEKVILNIAYHIFFMGIGSNSDKLVIQSINGLCEEKFILDLISNLTEVKEIYRRDPLKAIEIRLKDNPNGLSFPSPYMPFDGHISRLGHYFRHLYQTVKFISEQDENVINENKKCEYAKTLRAQLSDYEQLLLYYNINSTLGQAWTNEKENFIKRFRMIKNMPVPLADFALIPNTRFAEEIKYWKGKGKSFFGWDEREN